MLQTPCLSCLLQTHLHAPNDQACELFSALHCWIEYGLMMSWLRMHRKATLDRKVPELYASLPVCACLHAILPLLCICLA